MSTQTNPPDRNRPSDASPAARAPIAPPESPAAEPDGAPSGAWLVGGIILVALILVVLRLLGLLE